MRPTRLLAIAAVVTGGLVACATHHGAASERPHAITIQVVNNLTIPTGLDVYIIGPAGTQWRLGYVPGGNTAEFSYRPDSYGQRYRLVGKRQLERPIVSTPFTFGDANTRFAEWKLIPNFVLMYNGVETVDTVMTSDTTVKEDTTAKHSP
jgi:hypothetical protein